MGGLEDRLRMMEMSLGVENTKGWVPEGGNIRGQTYREVRFPKVRISLHRMKKTASEPTVLIGLGAFNAPERSGRRGYTL